MCNFRFRCKIIKFLPLTVIFLDYGNVSQVNEVREISQELAKIPNLAVRITFKMSEYNPVLEDEIRIKILMQVIILKHKYLNILLTFVTDRGLNKAQCFKVFFFMA